MTAAAGLNVGPVPAAIFYRRFSNASPNFIRSFIAFRAGGGVFYAKTRTSENGVLVFDFMSF